MPANYDFKPLSYGFQKDSPYLGLFNFYLHSYQQPLNLYKFFMNKMTNTNLKNFDSSAENDMNYCENDFEDIPVFHLRDHSNIT